MKKKTRLNQLRYVTFYSYYETGDSGDHYGKNCIGSEETILQQYNGKKWKDVPTIKLKARRSA